MYYRKYFSGSVDATTTTNQYYMGLDKVASGTSLGSGHVKNRSDVIGNAIISTLADIGYPNAYWDSTSGYVFLDKTNSRCGFYFSVQSSSMFASVGYVDGTKDYIISSGYGSGSSTTRCGVSVGAAYSPFQSNGTGATNYAFYVTVKGEPTGIFSIYIGTYNDHSSEDYMALSFCCGTDKRDNSALFGFSFNGVNVYTFYMEDYTTAESNDYGITSFVTNNNTLTLFDELVVLIPVFFGKGFMFLNNTYFNAGLSSGFYEIDSSTYWVQSYWMVKCVTTV